MDNSTSAHRPSLVLELPEERALFCLACAKPWPCPEARKVCAACGGTGVEWTTDIQGEAAKESCLMCWED
jgi:hypothetical protein